MTPALSLLSLDKIEWSKTNPRTDFGDLKDLAESIKERGLLQPIIVRKHPKNHGRFEGVVGERRFRASKLAKLETIDAIVRELDDRTVRELQHVENLQREDVSELDKATSYQALMKLDPKTYTVEGLATKFRVSTRSIYVTLQLLKLDPAVQKVIRESEGALTHSHGALIAPLPPALQQNVAKQLAARLKRGEAPTVREMKAVINQEVVQNLATAPFDVKDASLPRFDGKKAACTDCPFNTSNDPQAEKKDLCLNKACFSGKVDAQAERKYAELEKEAKAKGAKVLRVFDSSYTPGEAHISYDTTQQLRKKGVLALNEDVREVKANAKGAMQAVVMAGKDRGTVKWVATSTENSDSRGRHIPTPKERAERQQENLEQRIGALAKQKLLAAIQTKAKATAGALRLLVAYAIERSYDTKGIVKALGWGKESKRKSYYNDSMQTVLDYDVYKELEKVKSLDQLAGLGLMALCFTERPFQEGGYTDHVKHVTALLKLTPADYLAAAKKDMAGAIAKVKDAKKKAVQKSAQSTHPRAVAQRKATHHPIARAAAADVARKPAKKAKAKK